MKWFVNTKISKKLTLGFLFITLFSLITGLVGILNIYVLSRNEQMLYSSSTMGAITLGNAQKSFLSVKVTMRDIILHIDLDGQTYFDTIQSAFTNIETQFEAYDKTISDPQDRTNFEKLKSDFAKYKAEINAFIDAAKAGQSRDALVKLNQLTNTSGTVTDLNFTKMAKYNAASAAERVAKDKASAFLFMGIMGGIIVVSVVLSLILGRYIARLIGKPLNKMTDDAERLALGDVELTIENSGGRKDEIGRLEKAISKVVEGRKKQVRETHRLASGDLTAEMVIESDKDVLGKSLSELVDSFNALVLSIITSAEQVSSGAGLVSDSSAALSQGATEQASAVQELTAALQEIAAQTAKNADNASKANALAQNAKSDAENGNVQMNEMLKAMEDINASSRSINKIIKVIDDIAFQTNILALNAAVEAARAGQHGKGFAVVAEEVRTLAGKSAQAVKQTTDLIEGSIRKVEAGTRIANATASSLGKIVVEVADAAELVDSIAIASASQASSIEQINQGILQVSNVVQHNAATSEESAAASAELSSQADQLKQIVSTFKVKNGVDKKLSESQYLSLSSDVDHLGKY